MSQTSVLRIIKKQKQKQKKLDQMFVLGFGIWENRQIMFTTMCFSQMNRFFRSYGKVNNHNCDYYDRTNPHFTRQHDHHQLSLNVWAGIVGRDVSKSHFFDGPLNGKTYLNFLQNKFQIYLEICHSRKLMVPHYLIVE